MHEPSESAVVVRDPRNAGYAEGELVVGAEVARCRANGVVLVNADRALVESMAGTGYVRRGFGRGVTIDSFAQQARGPQFLCPVLLRMVSGRNRLNWAAELRRNKKAPKDAHGMLRLAIGQLDSGRAPGIETLAPVDLASLPMLEDPNEGWVVQGEALVDVDVAMALPLCLSAVGRGFDALWLAVGQR